MSTRLRLAAAGGAVLLVAAAGAGYVLGSASPHQHPPLSGASPTRMVFVLAYPNEEVQAAMKVGETLPMYTVSATVEPAGPRGEKVSVDRASVPAKAFDTTGAVAFEVQSLSRDGSLSTGDFTLVADPADATRWLPGHGGTPGVVRLRPVERAEGPGDEDPGAGRWSQDIQQQQSPSPHE